jgi:hypothetical protein
MPTLKEFFLFLSVIMIAVGVIAIFVYRVCCGDEKKNKKKKIRPRF